MIICYDTNILKPLISCFVFATSEMTCTQVSGNFFCVFFTFVTPRAYIFNLISCYQLHQYEPIISSIAKLLNKICFDLSIYDQDGWSY